MTSLPQPSGPYAVGTTVRHVVDHSRVDIFDPAGRAPRELMLQIWYPAQPPSLNNRAAHATYVDEGGLLGPLADLIGLPSNAFDHLESLATHGLLDAPVAGHEALPVLVFSHGRCGFRGHNTVLVETLASHGYVVACIDHPYASSGVAFPDGRTVMFDKRLLPPWPRRLQPGLDPAVMDEVLPYLGQDVTFVLDELERLNDHDPDALLTRRLDMSRLATFGVSLGGMLAAEACATDERVGACLIMDVYLPRAVVRAGLQRPVMWITRDAQTMRGEGWEQADIDDTHNTMREVYDRLPGAGYIVLIPGMFHIDFSDGGLLSPLLDERGLRGSVPVERCLAVVDAYSRAFFDAHVMGTTAPLLDASPDPGVVLETHHSALALG